jgi:hypothetical protein
MTISLRSTIAVASCLFVFGSIASAGTVSASLFSPAVPVGSVVTPIALAGHPDGTATIIGSGFTITFSTALDEGLVHAVAGDHAIPVAGVSGGLPEYLTADFGSPLTLSSGASGDYLSTGIGSITITFTTPQTSLALLWGSIDIGNSLTFNDASSMLVTGTQIEALAAGFVGNGFQGPGGSAYVVVNTSTPFTRVVAASSVVSLEIAGVAGGTVPFVPTPEPGTTMLLGAGLVGIGYFGRRLRRRA